jgi:hypothetical protein
MASSLLLLEELYELSPNKELFEKLRNGQNLIPQDQELANDVHDTTEPTTTTLLLWQQTRHHLVVLVQQNDAAGLEQYIASSNEDDKVKIYGECILALTATKNNNNNNAELRMQLRKVLRTFLQVSPRDETTERARREWLCILWHELADELTVEQKLHLRYVIASWTNQCRPGLVGHSFYQLGCAALAAGDVAQARQCYQSVENDMVKNLKSTRIPQNLRFEVRGILYWYRQACASLVEMQPALSADLQTDLQWVEQQYSAITFEPPSYAMIGPIAKSYLPRNEYLKKLLQEICATDCSDEALQNVCFRYDYCHEIDTLLFAVERHRLVLPILAGVHLSYEPAIQEALGALRSVDSEP